MGFAPRSCFLFLLMALLSVFAAAPAVGQANADPDLIFASGFDGNASWGGDPGAIEVLSPQDGAEITEERIEVALRVRTGGRDISNVSVNAAPADWSEHVDGHEHYSVAIDLEPGDNTLLAQVQFADGTQRQSSLSVTHSPEPDPEDEREIAFVSPAAGAVVDAAEMTVELRVRPEQTAIDHVSVNGHTAVWQHKNGDYEHYSVEITLSEGENTLAAEASFDDGAQLQASRQVVLESDPDEEDHRALTFVSPGEGAILGSEFVLVTVAVETDGHDVADVLINQQPAAWIADHGEQQHYQAELFLEPGDNSLSAMVRFADNTELQASRLVVLDPAPVVTVTSPQDFQAFGPAESAKAGAARDLTGKVERGITITGHVSRPVESVQINQQGAQLDADGQHFEFQAFFLHEGVNLVSVTATDALGRSGSQHLTLYVDQTAPIITIENIADQAITSNAHTDVRGVVNDAVEPGLGAPEPEVWIHNLANDTLTQAGVADGYYLARDIPLALGLNPLTVTATDSLGNAREQTTQITRISAGSDRLTLLSGDHQSAPVTTVLPEPLRIVAMDVEGLPLADLPVRFDITRGSGSISHHADGPTYIDGLNPARNLTVLTDASGQAEVWLTVGEQPWLGGNQVRAWHEDIAEDVTFTATGERGAPERVMIAGGMGTQYGLAGGQPLDALRAIVLDAHNNPIPGIEITYDIVAGDAHFQGPDNTTSHSQTLTSDKNGLTAARPRLGAQPGIVEVRAHTTHEGQQIGRAIYRIINEARSDGPTQFTGVVLDHTGAPLPGIRLSIDRTPLNTISDEDGRFLFASGVPAGKIDLFIDGRDVQGELNGEAIEYPAMHFESVVLEGRTNQMPHPIYLPPVHTGRAQWVGGDEDVSLTIPGFEGFEMIVKANSVTFPDGAREGYLTVSPVHNDRLPMVPPGPAATAAGLAWTLQPSDARFDPPIEVRLPNVTGLAPGRTMPIIQWDHDLAVFVPMGQGTVEETASQIITDPGSGITKAGWGCGEPPPPPEDDGTNCSESIELEIWADGESEKLLLASKSEDVVSVDFSSRIDGECENPRIHWGLGDGSGQTMQSFTHSYDNAGDYSVEARLTCRCGQSGVKSAFANVRVAVFSVESVEFESDYLASSKNSRPFYGHQEWTFDPRRSPVPDRNAVIHFEDVKADGSFDVIDFEVDVFANLSVDDDVWDDIEYEWTQVEGPDVEVEDVGNGRLTIRGLNSGGVYRFKFDITNFDLEPSYGVLLLPFAGAEIDEIVRADIARADAFAEYMVENYSFYRRNNIIDGRRLFWNSGMGDYRGRPYGNTNEVVWAYTQVDETVKVGLGAVVTWKGRPQRLAKASNFLVGYAARKMGVWSHNGWLSSRFIGELPTDLRDWIGDESGDKSWDSGWGLADGGDYDSVVQSMVDEIWGLSNEKNRLPWPNTDATTTHVRRSDHALINEEISSPGFLYIYADRY